MTTPYFLLPAKVGDNFLSSGQINEKSYFIPNFSRFFTYALHNILKLVHSPPSLCKPTKPPSLISIRNILFSFTSILCTVFIHVTITIVLLIHSRYSKNHTRRNLFGVVPRTGHCSSMMQFFLLF
jgi:hypothetical protein